MKLCFITHAPLFEEQGSYYIFPASVKLLELLSPLYEEIELCAPLSDDPVCKNYPPLYISNLKISPLPNYYNRWEITAFKHIFKLMRSLWPSIKRADTVFLYVPNYICIVAWWVCLLQRKRFVVRLAENWYEGLRMAFCNQGMIFLGNIAGFLHELIVKLVVKSSTLTIANGRELADIYGKNNSHVVHCISSTYHECDIASTIAGNGSRECRLLYVGRLIFNKGLSELFRAAKDLWAEGLDFHIWLAGDGTRREEIRTEAEELGIIDKVEFLGWIAANKLNDVYRSCDIFAFPSYTEGMPKAVTEAMSNGLATVVTDLYGLRGIVESDKTGLVVPIKDVAALREALRKLILDKSLRDEMAKAGLERSHRFTVEAERKCVKTALQEFGFLPHAAEDEDTKR